MHLQVDIGHDGQDERDRWHLEWVRVTNLTTGETATFKCNRWGLTALAAPPTPALPLCPSAQLPFLRLLDQLSRTPIVRQNDCLHMGPGPGLADALDCLVELARSTEILVECAMPAGGWTAWMALRW